jgi:predicted nucleic acid-binding protein
MIRMAEPVFVDTGAWIALAEIADPLHTRAVEHWEAMARAGARPVTSAPVVLETFAFLDRRGSRAAAIRWHDSLGQVARLEVLGCGPDDLAEARRSLDRKDFVRVSLVDATSFVLMRRHRIRVAFAFDVHFAVAGFRYVG